MLRNPFVFLTRLANAIVVRRVEDMAREIEALKSHRQEDLPRLTESLYDPESTKDSPEHPGEHPGVATLDASGITLDYFQIDDCQIDRNTVVELFTV